VQREGDSAPADFVNSFAVHLNVLAVDKSADLVDIDHYGDAHSIGVGLSLQLWRVVINSAAEIFIGLDVRAAHAVEQDSPHGVAEVRIEHGYARAFTQRLGEAPVWVANPHGELPIAQALQATAMRDSGSVLRADVGNRGWVSAYQSIREPGAYGLGDL